MKKNIENIIANELRKHKDSNLYSESTVNLITKDIILALLKEDFYIGMKVSEEIVDIIRDMQKG
jgi:signal recognition particle GTPase